MSAASQHPAQASPQVKVLMVCMGNICRSPLAQAVLEAKAHQAGMANTLIIDSAGTHAYHVGEAPDPRSLAVAKQHGYDCSGQRARHLSPADAETYDLLLVMDKRNLRDAKAILGSAAEGKLQLLLDFSTDPLTETEVPDPYFGGDDGFTHVLRLVESGCDGLLAHLRTRYALS